MRRTIKKNDRAFVISTAILAAVVLMSSATAAHAATDPFGIEEIYDTKDEDESEWYMEDDDPEPSHGHYDDGFPFYLGTLKTIDDMKEIADGVWRMDATTGSDREGVRMHVDRPDRGEWQDVEMTGYFRLLESDDQITMIARHGDSYKGNGGCDALGYYAMLDVDGDAYFKKKLYHSNGGYSDRVGEEDDAVSDPKGEWIGVKFAVYNLGSNEVKLELWVDEGDEGNDWEKVAEYTDDGNLSINGNSHCDRSRDHVIDEGQPRVSFRLDNSEFEFKDLSVREIEP